MATHSTTTTRHPLFFSPVKKTIHPPDIDIKNGDPTPPQRIRLRGPTQPRILDSRPRVPAPQLHLPRHAPGPTCHRPPLRLLDRDPPFRHTLPYKKCDDRVRQQSHPRDRPRPRTMDGLYGAPDGRTGRPRDVPRVPRIQTRQCVSDPEPPVRPRMLHDVPTGPYQLPDLPRQLSRFFFSTPIRPKPTRPRKTHTTHILTRRAHIPPNNPQRAHMSFIPLIKSQHVSHTPIQCGYVDKTHMGPLNRVTVRLSYPCTAQIC